MTSTAGKPGLNGTRLPYACSDIEMRPGRLPLFVAGEARVVGAPGVIGWVLVGARPRPVAGEAGTGVGRAGAVVGNARRAGGVLRIAAADRGYQQEG